MTTGTRIDPSRLRDDLGVYLVTAEPVGPRTLEVITAAVRGGVRVVQLRDKINSTADRITALQAIRRRINSRVTVIVNDDLDAALAVPGTGLHVGADDLHPAVARERLGPAVCIGWSIQDLDQLTDDDALRAADYVAASPVWSTPTKTDTGRPFGLGGVRTLRDLLPGSMPLVGIGGIGPANAAEVIMAGGDGVAVVSAICGAADPQQASMELITIVSRTISERSRS
jgi:thiamine-phosphate pyrophosphorylase